MYAPISQKQLRCIRPLLVVLLFLLGTKQESLLFAQPTTCACTNCPLPLTEGYSGDALLNVQGAVNNMLGVNGQSVCGVTVNFKHQYVADLTMTLTSPGGQSVQLMGNNVFTANGDTDFTTWNVTFVPCGISAMPDIGFDPQWDNTQPWGIFGLYDGTYQPYQGCLESFNLGSVNGTWALHIEDVLPNDTGIVNSWSLIFCDTMGINCFTCDADAGALNQPDVLKCIGDPSLALVLPPTYPAGVMAPLMPEYTYQYAITQNGNTIVDEIVASPNMTTRPPGVYTVCGLSYKTSQLASIPVPNNAITLNQLNVAFASAATPICADLSSNCVQVTIQPALPDTALMQSICTGTPFTFFGQVYSAPGTYVRTITQNGCNFTATLTLLGNPLLRDTVREVICKGGCSGTFGFATACATGIYSDTLKNLIGCDSLIRILDLKVLAVQNISFSPPNPVLACGASATTNVLFAQTDPASSIYYTWYQGGNPAVYSSGVQLTANTTGNYKVVVCEEQNQLFCCDSAKVTVTTSGTLPAPASNLTFNSPVCLNDTVFASINSGSGATSYQFSWPLNADFAYTPTSPADTLSAVIAREIGVFQVCAHALNACGSSDTICKPLTVLSPTVQPNLVGSASGCFNTPSVYSVTNVPAATQVFWTVTGDSIASIISINQDTLLINWLSNTTTGEVCVAFVGACGDTLRSCQTVALASPAIQPILVGTSSGCANNTAVYSVANLTTATQVVWSMTGGTIGFMSTDKDSIRVNWLSGATTGEVCVAFVGVCGDTLRACRTVNISPAATAPILVGAGASCVNSFEEYRISNLLAGSNVFWTVSGGNINFTSTDKDSVRVQWSAGFSQGQICASMIGICGDTVRTCLMVSLTNLSPLASVNSTKDTICLGETVRFNVPLTNTGVAYNWIAPASFTTISGGTGFEPVYRPNTAGVFDVCAFYSNSCQSSDTLCKRLVVLAQPVVQAGSDVLALCSSAVQLQGSGTGNWSILNGPPGASFSAAASPLSSFSGAAGTYQLVFSGGNGICTKSDTVTVQLGSAISFTQNTNQCLPGDTSFVIAASWSGGVAPFQLTGAPTLFTSSGTAGIFPSGSSATAIVQDANGCSDTLFTTFTCGCGNAPGSFSQNTLTGCVGQTITLPYNNDETPKVGQKVYFAVGANPNSISWINTPLQVYTSASIPFTTAIYAPSTTYYVVQFLADTLQNGQPKLNDNCLVYSQSIQIQWLTAPSITLMGDTTTCFGVPDTLRFTIQPNSILYPFTGTLSTGLGVVQNFTINGPGSFLISDTNPANGWYVVHDLALTQAPGCLSTDRDSIFVEPILGIEPIVADSATVCNSNSSVLNFETLVFTGFVGGFWSSNIGSGPYSNRSFAGVNSGIYPFVYQGPAGATCASGRDTCWVRVLDCACPIFQIALSAPNICNQDSIFALNSLIINAPPGLWSIAGTTTPAPMVTGANLNALDASAGIYTLTYTLTNPTLGCPSASSVPIVVGVGGLSAGNPLTDTLVFCVNDTSIIPMISRLQNADAGGIWKFVGTPVSPAIFAMQTSGMFEVSAFPAGIYTFQYKHSALLPCISDSSLVTFKIFNAPTANAGSDQLIDCSLPSAVLSAELSTQGSNLTYTWIDPQTSMILGQGLLYQTFAAGEYLLRITDTTLVGCSDTDQVTVISDASLPIGMLSVISPGCLGTQTGSITITDIVGGQAPFRTILDGVPQNGLRSWSGLAVGNHTLEIIDANDCSWSNQNVVISSMVGSLTLSLGNDVSILLGDSIQMVAQIASTSVIDTLIWSVLGMDSIQMSLTQTYAPKAPLRIRLTVRDSFGCSATDDVLIDVITPNALLVPNIFQPGSTLNGVITVFGSSDIERIELWQIYDRWGNRVHQATDFAPGDYVAGWNGIFGGKRAQSGVYVYSARYRLKDGRVIWLKGDLTVLW
jgi:Proprotein convertase P-domain/CHU_C Type IX secretion signal domain/PKD-like domain